jgi:hypothetical protein
MGEFPIDDFRRTIDTHLMGTFYSFAAGYSPLQRI